MRRSGIPRAWTQIGRLLPRSVRDLVFEPACLELWLRHARATSCGRRASRFKLWMMFSATFIAVGWYGVPRYIVNGGQVTKFGRVLKNSAISVCVILLLLLLPWVIEVTQL